MNIEKYGKHHQKKICNEVGLLVTLRAGKVELCRFPSKNVSPFQSKLRVRNVSTCPPNPVRQYLWSRRCLCHKNRLKNQSKCLFQNMPLFQCYKKPRKVCQTLVTTKPKVVTEQASEIRKLSILPEKSLNCMQVPQEVCGHSALKTKQGRKPKAQKQTGKQKPSPKKVRPGLGYINLDTSFVPGALHVSRWSSTTTEAVRE